MLHFSHFEQGYEGTELSSWPPLLHMAAQCHSADASQTAMAAAQGTSETPPPADALAQSLRCHTLALKRVGLKGGLFTVNSHACPTPGQRCDKVAPCMGGPQLLLGRTKVAGHLRLTETPHTSGRVESPHFLPRISSKRPCKGNPNAARLPLQASSVDAKTG